MSGTKTIHAHQRNRKLLETVIAMQRTDVVHVHRAQARRKRISFTEFLTLLCLLTKKAFMNGNKRVVTCSLTAV